MDEDRNIITLYDEEENEDRFEVLAVLDVDDGRYAILMPEDLNGGNDEAFVLKMEQDEDGELILTGIHGEELDTVVQAYEEIAKEQNN